MRRFHFGFAVFAVTLSASAVPAAAQCAATGFESYYIGVRNVGTYLGNPGDKCDTVMLDPLTGISGIVDTPPAIGLLEIGDRGWNYTFSTTTLSYTETMTIIMNHATGDSTTFTVTARTR